MILPPHLLLKSMIKRGLSATSNSFLVRPRTAQSGYKNNKNHHHTLGKLKSIELQEK